LPGANKPEAAVTWVSQLASGYEQCFASGMPLMQLEAGTCQMLSRRHCGFVSLSRPFKFCCCNICSQLSPG
jgi:hypothetical protein